MIIISMLWLAGLMYIWGTVNLLQIMAEIEFFSTVGEYWLAGNFVGKTLMILLLAIFLPAVVLYTLGSLCIGIYNFVIEKSFPGIYSGKDACSVRVVLPENSVLDLLRENKIPFSIGNGFIRFPDNETFDIAKEFLGSYKIYEA